MNVREGAFFEDSVCFEAFGYIEVNFFNMVFLLLISCEISKRAARTALFNGEVILRMESFHKIPSSRFSSFYN